MTTPLDLLVSLHAESFPRAWSRAEFEEILDNPNTHLVANDHGFAILRVIEPEAEIITLSIRPAARGQGHGRDLLEQALLVAAASRVEEMFLEVDETNQAAINLYVSAGFTTRARRPGYYAHKDSTPTDALLMVREFGVR